MASYFLSDPRWPQFSWEKGTISGVFSGYGADFDAAFSDAIAAGALEFSDTMQSCYPSELKLKHSCSATLRLAHVANQTNSAARATIADSLLPALPDTCGNLWRDGKLEVQTTARERYEYWRMIWEFPGFSVVLELYEWYCQRLRYGEDHDKPAGQIEMTWRDLNFTRNCELTESFWRSHMDRQSDYGLSYSLIENSTLPFWRASMPSGYSNIGDSELRALARGFTRSMGFEYYLTKSAVSCIPSACRLLKFSGNADIAGIGAMATYGAVVTLTTCLCAVCLWLGPNYRPEKEHGFRRAIVEVSISFLDSMPYLHILTTIAAVRLCIRGKTLYEKSLAVLSAYLMQSASLLSLLIYYFPQARAPTTVPRLVCQAVALVGCPFASPVWASLWGSTLQDYACYSNFNPQDYVVSVGWLWSLALSPLCLGIFGIFVSWILFDFVSLFRPLSRRLKYSVRHYQERATPIVLTITGIGAYALMWTSLVYIIQIRRAAMEAFGPSYADNSVGYGSIMALGFCLQTAVQFLSILLYRPATSSEQDTRSTTTNTPSTIDRARWNYQSVEELASTGVSQTSFEPSRDEDSLGPEQNVSRRTTFHADSP